MEKVDTLENFYLPLIVVEESFNGLRILVIGSIEDAYVVKGIPKEPMKAM